QERGMDSSEQETGVVQHGAVNRGPCAHRRRRIPPGVPRKREREGGGSDTHRADKEFVLPLGQHGASQVKTWRRNRRISAKSTVARPLPLNWGHNKKSS